MSEDHDVITSYSIHYTKLYETDRADAGRIRVVDRLLVFLEDGVPHLVARRAEFEAVGRLHGGVEAAPENDTRDDADPDQDNRAAFGFLRNNFV